MQINYLISIKTNLDLYNSKKISINDFVIKIYDDIFYALNKVPGIDKDEIRAQFIEHLFDNYEFLRFENEYKFNAYLIKFAKNKQMSENRQKNRNVEITENVETTDNSWNSLVEARWSGISIQQSITETGLNITELSKILEVSRQIIYNYIELNSAPYNIKRKIIKLKGFHDKILKVQELRESILNEFGSLSKSVFKQLGSDRSHFFMLLRKGISYTQYLKLKQKIDEYKSPSINNDVGIK